MFRKLLYGERQNSVPRTPSNAIFTTNGSRKSSMNEDKWSRAPKYLHFETSPVTLALHPKHAKAVLADHSTTSLLDIDQEKVTCKISYCPKSKPINPIPVNAQCNPLETGQDQFCVVVTSSNSIYMLQSSNDTLKVQQSKKSAHRRPITDVDWCRRGGGTEFMTCAQEEFIFMWDHKDIRKPILAFNSLAPSTRARFNKLNKNLIASSHDNGIYLWDVRKSRCPITVIGSHSSRVYSIDWSPISERLLVSSSQDSTVKFWDCMPNATTVDKHLLLEDPAWNVQFSALGDSFLVCHERSLTSEDIAGLSVYSTKTGRLVHTYNSQSPFIKVETAQLNKTKECRMIALLKNGFAHCSTLYPTLTNSSSDLENYSHTDDIRDNQALQDEFNNLLNDKPPYTDLIKLDAAKRMCLILVTVCLYEIEITLSFPKEYPKNIPPTFSFSKGSNLQSSIKAKLQKVLRITSTQHVCRNQPCLEPCLKQLVKTLESIKALETTNKGDVETDAPKLPPVPVNIYGGEQDSSVPFPRTSGARFCGAHFLVCFTRPSYIQKNQRESDNEAYVTPRSLSALGAYIKAHRNPSNSRTGMSPLYPSFVAKNESDVTISSYYYREKKSRRRRFRDPSKPVFERMNVPSAAVLIYSMPGVLPVCYQLASRYKLDLNDPLEACRHNYEVAKDCKRTDLGQVWTLAAQIVESQLANAENCAESADLPWPMHIFGRKLAEHLIDSYLKLYDIQTVAMLCCVFGEVSRRQSSRRRYTGAEIPSASSRIVGRSLGEKTSNVLKKTWQKMMSSGGSPYNSITGSSPSTHGGIPSVFMASRFNKKDSLKDANVLEAYTATDDIIVAAHEPDVLDEDTYLLDPAQITRYDQLKQHYAELLYKWNLLEQRCLVLNHMTMLNVHEPNDVLFKKRCSICNSETDDVTCARCRNVVFRCTICELGVRGISFFCLICYHGGHVDHLKEWFESHTLCPTGCGCECISICAE